MRDQLRTRLAFLLLLSLTVTSFSLPTESLPTYHWAYDIIEELQLNGLLAPLDLTERPITRGQIALAIIDEETIGGGKNQRLMDLLLREFQSEIEILEPSASERIKEAIENVISPAGLSEQYPLKGDVGIRLQGDWYAAQNQDSETDGIALAQAGVQFRPNIAAHGRLRLDSRLPDDPTYEGKEWRGLAGYAEAGYLRIDGRVFDIFLGRDRFTVGSGKQTHLLLSDAALPLDAVGFSASLKHFRYSFLTAQLDTMMHGGYSDEVLKRYLALHRIRIKPHPRLSIGLSEAVLYGGPNRTFELQFINPFLYWHGEVLNRKGTGNIFVMLDLDWYPRNGMEFYGEFLIDDLQIEKETSKDLEPSEIGWLVGSRFSDLPMIPNAVLSLEYMGVTNRTYNSMNPYEKYLHWGQPLGCEFGNDFDRMMVSTSQWIKPYLQCTMTASYSRKGEGSIAAPFDTTYLQYTVDEGYDEPFPTGVVQKETTLSLELFSILNYWAWVRFETGMTWISNAGHVSGEKDDQGWIRLSAVIELDDVIK